jgi:hypothetical protein
MQPKDFGNILNDLLNPSTDWIDIQSRLKKLGKTQRYLGRKFNRKSSQISAAIRTNSYPTLKQKIIIHLEKLESNRNETQTKNKS